jgi:hypothetical protein
MPDLTEKEYDALDEYYTTNTLLPVGKPGFFALINEGLEQAKAGKTKPMKESIKAIRQETLLN